MKRITSILMALILIAGSLSGMPIVKAEETTNTKNKVEASQGKEVKSKSLASISEYNNNEMIVVYKDERKSNAVHSFQEKDENKVEQITDKAMLYTLDSEEEMEQAIEELEEDKNVDYIQPNYTYRVEAVDVKDEYFYEQWALHNDGTYDSWITGVDPVEDIDINAPEAWELWDSARNKQREVIVAVIDTGVKYDHEDLKAGMWVNEKEIPGNGRDDDGNGYVDDYYGWNFYGDDNEVYNKYSYTEDSHGTHVTGCIVAERNNIGIAGLASNDSVKVMPVKALGGEEGMGDTVDIIKGINYAEKMGASICNMSLGGDAELDGEMHEVDRLFSETIRTSNMLFVAAAGNGDENGIGKYTDIYGHYPSSFGHDNIISVANIQCNGELAESSNYGIATVHLAAPGTEILSTSTDYTNYGEYEFLTGTSMATPMVTAVAAMVYSYYDNITLSQVKYAILDSVKCVDGLESKTLTGGMVDAYAALKYYEGAETPRPTQPVVTETPGPTQPVVTETPGPTQPVVTETPRPTQPTVTETPRPTQPTVTETPRPIQSSETSAIKLTKYSDLDWKAQDSNSGMVDGVITAPADYSEPYKVYKITMPEDGLYRINYTLSENGDMTWDDFVFTLYSNAQMTKQVCTEELYGTTSKDQFITLPKGVYYLKVKLERTAMFLYEIDSTFTVSFGYLPKGTEILKVTKHVDTNSKTVTFKISTMDQNKLWIGEQMSSYDWDSDWDDGKRIYGNTYTIRKDGVYTIRLEDIYGNIYRKTFTINDFKKPNAPTIEKYISGTKEIIGKASANTTITVIADGVPYTAKVSASGTYIIKLNKVLKVGNKIVASVKSPMGMVSDVRTVSVKNQKIAKPKVTTYKKGTRVVKGKAKKNATVTVKIGKKTYSGKVSKNGKYSVKVAKLKKGAVIKVSIKDVYGNYSDYGNVKVK